ncbi:cystathionine beta-synthase [Polaribacter sp. P097]|uniref:cystathionine beta-synthase n=1 Tax=Polaribacter sp. P097 TaxID=3117398 RepID=UPI002FE19F53
MIHQKLNKFIAQVVDNMPSDWVNLTTHRLDIYNESLAKSEFLAKFEALFQNDTINKHKLENLPTAYDYIRLGHPLSCVLEWILSKLNDLHPDEVISFSSLTMPILAVLRKNLLENKDTAIYFTNSRFNDIDFETLKRVYGYNFSTHLIDNESEIQESDSSTIFISDKEDFKTFNLNSSVDFYVNAYSDLGSVLLVNGVKNKEYTSEIQHVRRRESVAMTPLNSLKALNLFLGRSYTENDTSDNESKKLVQSLIKDITGTKATPLLGSSGLSIQYAIMMGLVDDAQQNHKNKAIKFIVPPNCYGGTNDQARRVAALDKNIDVVDLLVDGKNDMVSSIDRILDEVANEDAVPYIIAEIPTNPRVEVPNLEDLKRVLTKERKTNSGETAIDPIFILDQTFCPNYQFLGEGEILSTCRSIAYASGSKFPSGGKCTAGYCVSNDKAKALMHKIEHHLTLCDNEATKQQYDILAEQLPSMNHRILEAYQNTKDFVSFIQKVLPEAKINFVSEQLALQGFTPSVFSLDLPTKGTTLEEQEAYKRALNLKLINLMITEIPDESKFCVSYGQLKGCYWTVPATSTQGTTKEGDKDYIVRASLSPDLDLELHKKVFTDFVNSL